MRSGCKSLAVPPGHNCARAPYKETIRLSWPNHSILPSSNGLYFRTQILHTKLDV